MKAARGGGGSTGRRLLRGHSSSRSAWRGWRCLRGRWRRCGGLPRVASTRAALAVLVVVAAAEGCGGHHHEAGGGALPSTSRRAPTTDLRAVIAAELAQSQLAPLRRYHFGTKGETK